MEKIYLRPKDQNFTVQIFLKVNKS